jgi:hypothetical protein
MNKQKLSEMRFKQVRVRPVARRIDEIQGVELPPTDDKWMIVDSSREEVTLRNLRSDQKVRMRSDHIQEYMTDLDHSDGIFQLKSQIFLFRRQLPRLEPLMRI